jgi:hypothetical protein
VRFTTLLLITPAWAAPHCLTYAEKTLGCLQTLCDDGMRAVSTYNKTMQRWESIVTAPPDHAEKARPSRKVPRR